VSNAAWSAIDNARLIAARQLGARSDEPRWRGNGDPDTFTFITQVLYAHEIR
jgi:hypothetical protein